MKPPKVIILPWLPKYEGFAIMGRLVIMKRGYERLISHELVHIRQQQEIGAIKYHWKWIFNKTFRARVEIEAYTEANGKTPSEIIMILKNHYLIDLSLAEFHRIKSLRYDEI